MNAQVYLNGYPNARTIEAENVNLGFIMEFGNLETSSMRAALAELPVLLASAPHRLMFFAGATAIIGSMLWWACVLGSGVYGAVFPASPVPAGWAHSIFTQYGMLPFFMFGFLLTVFPRWMGQPALGKRHYVPVFIGVFGGYLLSHAGLLDRKPLLLAGLVMMLAGWTYALFVLGGILVHNGAKDRTALSCFSALVLGFLGLAAFTAFAFGASPELALVAIKTGTFGLLLPIYFTVCHRMLPFFSASAIGPRYQMFKPAWSLPVFWVLVLAHLGLELARLPQWLWLADAPLMAFFLTHWIRWQPWKCMRPGLLAVLHVAASWLPIAFGLYALQSLLLFFDSNIFLGRMPVHALTIGFFGSMLVAMVTRVTQGHSGRPLEMGRIPWLTFVLLQIVVLIRLFAEVAQDASGWLAIAAFAWLVAFLPWVLRSLWIFLTPRIDGNPG
ncbi:NnrS family protein [Dokdonella sp.]|uniref:NnrS family protein n=1 Tax=Dokdonella sp. TaxID=2291710 RepID=UPI003C6F7D72